MATVTFYTNDTDGTIRQDNANYTTCHDASSGGGISAANSTEKLGQWFHAGTSTYVLQRFFAFFDTSSISDDATIISAKLVFLPEGKSTVDTDFNIVIRSGMPDYPHENLVLGDYLYSRYSGNGGFINTANYVVDVLATITLNATGLGWINKTGTTKLALISSRDIASIIPSGEEYITICSRFSPSGSTWCCPKLIVTYATEQTPLVTTVAPTGIKDDHCTGNGNVTAGGAILEKGFKYGLTEVGTWEVKTSIYSGEGTYSLPVYGLLPETTYYIRAFATNSYGTAYGKWLTFTTTASPSYGMYEEDNAATICFYVRQIGGKWSIKHGPYTTDQADIEITKILIEGKGKYQIKFESDVLTGISAGVMVKMDIKARTGT